MKEEIDELVGRINGRYGSLRWTPISYKFRSLPFDTLTALYSVSDTALVTSLRDGMNLVAKEYVATRADGSGVLVLSEMAGAAKESTQAIMIFTEYYPKGIAMAIKDRAGIPIEEQRRRNRARQEYLHAHTAYTWGDNFVGCLLTKESPGEVKAGQVITGDSFLTKKGGEGRSSADR